LHALRLSRVQQNFIHPTRNIETGGGCIKRGNRWRNNDIETGDGSTLQQHLGVCCSVLNTLAFCQLHPHKPGAATALSRLPNASTSTGTCLSAHHAPLQHTCLFPTLSLPARPYSTRHTSLTAVKCMELSTRATSRCSADTSGATVCSWKLDRAASCSACVCCPHHSRGSAISCAWALRSMQAAGGSRRKMPHARTAQIRAANAQTAPGGSSGCGVVVVGYYSVLADSRSDLDMYY